MRALRVVGVGAVVVLLSGCNCGPMMVADAGMPGVDAGVDAGFDAGVDGGPLRVAYRIGGVTGTYGGDGKNVVSATRTDFLTAVTCTYSGGTDAGLVVGADGGTTMIQVIGAASCPPRMATAVADDGGQAAPPCTTGTFDAPAALFQGTIEQAGWADDAVVTFKIQAPPSGAPGCNNATLVVSAGAPWGIEGSTTAGTFKQLKPFTVKFTGPAGGRRHEAPHLGRQLLERPLGFLNDGEPLPALNRRRCQRVSGRSLTGFGGRCQRILGTGLAEGVRGFWAQV